MIERETERDRYFSAQEAKNFGLVDDVLKLVKIIQEKVWAKNEIHLESEVRIWP